MTASIASLLVASNADAATYTWNGGGGNVNWNTPGNWTGGTPTSASTTDLVFAGTTNIGTLVTPLNQDIANPMTLRSITFDSTAGSFFLGGSAIAIQNATTFTITQSSANSQNIANSIRHTGSNNSVTLAFAASGAGTVTLSGPITDGNGQRKVGMTKSGSSTFVLANATSDFSNGITISGGVLRSTSLGALGVSNVTIGTGGVLGLDADFNVNGRIVNASAGIVALNANNSTLTGLNGSSAFLGALGSFSFTGATLASGSASTYRLGGTGGTLTITQANVITGANNLIVGSAQTNGTGSVTFSGNQNYSGNTTVANGSILTTNGTLSSSAVAVDNGGTLNIGPTGALAAVTVLTANGTTNFNNATQTISQLTDSGTGARSVVLNGTVLSVSGTSTYSGTITGNGGLTKTTGGTLTLSGSAANSYSGNTTVSAGTLNVQGGGLAATGAVQLNGGTLLLGTSNVINDSAAITLNGGTLNTGGNDETLGTLILSVDSTIDFGSGTGSRLDFTSIGTIAAGAKLSILNWSGTPAISGSDPSDDRLVFQGNYTTFTSLFAQADVSFNGVQGYQAIDFGGTSFEIVAVPEPSTTAAIGGLALCALIGYRERRRIGEVRSRLGMRNRA